MKRQVKLTLVGVLDLPAQELAEATGYDPFQDSSGIDEAVAEYVRGDFEATLDEIDFDLDGVEVTRIEGEIDDLAEDPDEEEDSEEEDGKPD